jgi:Copper type II ascorbate-dependent monooxygenase, C-terminal domain
MAKRASRCGVVMWSFIAPLMVIAACSMGDACAPGADSGGKGSPTGKPGGANFHRDVEPLLQDHCVKCHQPGGLAPFSLVTYADARAMAPAIADETAARRMPPWGAQDSAECKPRLGWNHDERLTDVEIAIIGEWSAKGAPEGDPKDAPPPRELSAISLPSPTLTLEPKQPFVASGPSDQYHCFVLDVPELADGGYIDGINVVPGNRSIVHHAVVLSDTKGTFAAKAGSDGSFDCTGMADDGSGRERTLLQVWVPGTYPIDLPPNVGMRIAPGAKIVMRIHYSPGGRTAAADSTKVELRIAKTRPEFLLSTMEIGNSTGIENGLLPGPDDGDRVRFRIPANAHDHVESMQLTFRADRGPESGPFYLYGVMGHEHLAGIDVKVDLDHDGDRQCLLEDKWDFHWQRMYTYAAPPEKLPMLEPGDKILLRCTYDNSMQNRRLGAEYKARGLVPMDIYLGEQTLDEMCLFIPQVLERNR